MDLNTLINLSGIEAHCRAYDYAIPMNADGSYPFNGRAISIYRDRLCPVLLPYEGLAMLAMGNGHYTEEIAGELLGASPAAVSAVKLAFKILGISFSWKE